jgi:hypothetical protein
LVEKLEGDADNPLVLDGTLTLKLVRPTKESPDE